MAIIAVSNLTKYYGKTIGIEDVSFQVEPGEIFGFLGPNGAGKTTTIRLLMDLLGPDRGRIFLFDIQLKRNQVDLKQRIGYLPGEFMPYTNLTGHALLTYMAKYRSHAPELREKLLAQLDFHAHELSKKIKHLSHGNRQKLGIILALEHNPDLAILDEPTSGLDPLVQEAFYEILWDFQRRGKTIFLSSHILPEVEKVCQRVAIIRNGRIVALEEIEKLKTKRPRRLIISLKENVAGIPPQLPGTRLLDYGDNQFSYFVEGELSRLLKALSDLPVENIVFPEPDLEDIFMEYYTGTKN